MLCCVVWLSLICNGCAVRLHQGGEIECTPAGPTGILKESAVQLVAEAMGTKTFADKKRFISEGLARCCKMVSKASVGRRLSKA